MNIERVKPDTPKIAPLICELVEKYYTEGKRVLIFLEDKNKSSALDEYLWTFKQASFIPHAIFAKYIVGGVLHTPTDILHPMGGAPVYMIATVMQDSNHRIGNCRDLHRKESYDDTSLIAASVSLISVLLAGVRLPSDNAWFRCLTALW